jgi:glutamate-1-semialdehyde 2,1-aminomutase
MNLTNDNLFNEAKKYIPGGVNSPVRSFNSVGGRPFFTKKAQGAFLYDIENKQYIDYICSWGANIVGHANPHVVEKVTAALKNGFSYGTPTELEVELAKTIVSIMPNIEKVRLVSSGTEATMSAIRLARGYTGKKYIIKFNGCYHGHSDNLLVKAGSGLATFSNPSSSGVSFGSVEDTIVLEYNSIEDLQATFDKYGNDIACIIMEPFAGNMNLVRPIAEFLFQIQSLCKTHKTLLICDEVMTGFRVALGGAQQLLGLKPDITAIGKVVGGGMPLAAFGGRAEIMDYLSPNGSVYQAGTLSGNPIAVTSGLATLELIQKTGFYEAINSISGQLTTGLQGIANDYSIPFCTNFVGGMFGFYFSDKLPQNLKEVKLANEEHFNKFFHMMLDAGVYFAPSMYEAGFVCIAHSNEIIEQTLDAAKKVFAKL